jgi:Reverse transcriptase (RNA-dependent DNA polymerase)
MRSIRSLELERRYTSLRRSERILRSMVSDRTNSRSTESLNQSQQPPKSTARKRGRPSKSSSNASQSSYTSSSTSQPSHELGSCDTAEGGQAQFPAALGDSDHSHRVAAETSAPVTVSSSENPQLHPSPSSPSLHLSDSPCLSPTFEDSDAVESSDNESSDPSVNPVSSFRHDPGPPSMPPAARTRNNINLLREAIENFQAESKPQSHPSHTRTISDWQFAPADSLDHIMKHKQLTMRIPAACTTSFIHATRPILKHLCDSLHSSGSDDDNFSAFFHYVQFALLPARSLTMIRGWNGRKNRKQKIIMTRLQSIRQQQSDIDHELATSNFTVPVPSESVVPCKSDTIPSSSILSQEVSHKRNKQLERRILGAKLFVENGYLKRAAKHLSAPLKLDRTAEELYSSFLALHPQTADVSRFPCLPPDTPPILIDPDSAQWKSLLQHMDTGSAPGVSGWNGNYIATLARDPDCCKYLAYLTQRIINNDLDDSIRRLLTVSLLVGIDKPNGGVRPIAIGEILLRLSSIYCMSLIEDAEIRRILHPHQFGVCVPNGCESVVHTVEQALSNTTRPRFVMKIDLKNAFNSVDRGKMLQALFSYPSLRPLYRFAMFCYGSPSDLVIRDSSHQFFYSSSLMSREGCRQGGPESPLLFAVALQHFVLRKLHDDFPSVLQAFMLDDGHIMHDLASVCLEAYESFQFLCENELNLLVQPNKGQFIYYNLNDNPNDVRDRLDDERVRLCYPERRTMVPVSVRSWIRQLKIPIFVDGAEILGTAVGASDEIIGSILHPRLKELHKDTMSRLTHPRMNVQHAMLLLRMCLVPKLNYILRTVRPSAVESLAGVCDTLIMNTALAILKIDRKEMSDHQMKQMRLPMTYGGFGLHAMNDIRHLAFLSSIASTLASDEGTFNLFTSLSPGFTQAISISLDYVYAYVNADEVKNFLPRSANEFFSRFRRQSEPQLQKKLTHAASKTIYSALVNSFGVGGASPDEFHFVRLKHVAAPGAGIWKNVFPSEPLLQCSDEQYRINARIMLGLVPCKYMPHACGFVGCNTEIDPLSPSSTLHPLCCTYQKSKETTQRHNQVQTAVETLADRCNVNVIRYEESEGGVVDSSFCQGATSIKVDYVVSLSTAPSYLHTSAINETLHIANEKAGGKHTHHYPGVDVGTSVSISSSSSFSSSSSSSSDSSRSVVAMSLDAYGGFTNEAKEFITNLALLAEHHSCIYNRKELVQCMRGAVAIAVARGNADIIIAAIHQAARATASYRHQLSRLHTQRPNRSLSVPPSDLVCHVSGRSSRKKQKHTASHRHSHTQTRMCGDGVGRSVSFTSPSSHRLIVSSFPPLFSSPYRRPYVAVSDSEPSQSLNLKPSSPIVLFRFSSLPVDVSDVVVGNNFSSNLSTSSSSSSDSSLTSSTESASNFVGVSSSSSSHCQSSSSPSRQSLHEKFYELDEEECKENIESSSSDSSSPSSSLMSSSSPPPSLSSSSSSTRNIIDDNNTNTRKKKKKRQNTDGNHCHTICNDNNNIVNDNNNNSHHHNINNSNNTNDNNSDNTDNSNDYNTNNMNDSAKNNERNKSNSGYVAFESEVDLLFGGFNENP